MLLLYNILNNILTFKFSNTIFNEPILYVFFMKSCFKKKKNPCILI